MRFHRSFEDILRGRTAVRVLRTLVRFPTKEFTGRELARESGTDPPKAIRFLHELRNHGLVDVRGAGPAQLWRLRSKHHMAQGLSSIFDNERRSLDALSQTLRKSLRPHRAIERVLLFGSIARGEERSDSDVDLLIVVRTESDKKRVEQVLHRLRNDIAERFGNGLSPLVYSRKEILQKKRLGIARNIEREGITILEKSV